MRVCGVHRRLPQLLGVHLAEALVARDRDALLALGEDVADEGLARGDLGLAPVHDHERRLVDLADLLVGGVEGAVLGRRHERVAELDAARVAVAVGLEAHVEDSVLLVPLEEDVAAGLAQGADQLEEARLVGERLGVLDPPAQEHLDDAARHSPLLEAVEELRHRDHPAHGVRQPRALDLLARGEADLPVLGGAGEEERVERVLVLQVRDALAVLHLVERRLRDVEMAALDQLLHLPVEEREQQRADVAAVDVGVAHDDDAVVAQPGDVEVVLADPGAERRDDVADLLRRERLVEPRLLDVEDLAAQGKHGLEAAVAALLGRAAGRVALHEEELAPFGVPLLALGELAGEPGAVERALAAGEVASLACRLAGARRVEDLRGDALRVVRVLLEEGGEPLVDEALDDALHLGVAELRLRLALELRVRDLHAHDGGEPFAGVLAVEAVAFLQHPRGEAVAVEAPGESAPEAREVAAPVVGVDVVRVAVDVLGVAVVPLHRDLDEDAVALALDLDRLRRHGLLVAVEVLDERGDAALVLEAVLLAVALVLEGDEDAAVEEAELAQALREGVEAVGRGLEDLQVGLEGDLGAALVGGARLLEARLRHPAGVALAVDLALAPDLDLERLGERVHDGDADAVEAARDLVGALVELAPRVELREDDLGGVEPRLVGPDGDAAAVVDDRHRVVDVDRDVDLVAEAGEGLVDGVVDDLVDEVVQPRLSGRADVHRRTDADGFEALQDPDGLHPVVRRRRVALLGLGLAHDSRSAAGGRLTRMRRAPPRRCRYGRAAAGSPPIPRVRS